MRLARRFAIQHAASRTWRLTLHRRKCSRGEYSGLSLSLHALSLHSRDKERKPSELSNYRRAVNPVPMRAKRSSLHTCRHFEELFELSHVGTPRAFRRDCAAALSVLSAVRTAKLNGSCCLDYYYYPFILFGGKTSSDEMCASSIRSKSYCANFNLKSSVCIDFLGTP